MNWIKKIICRKSNVVKIDASQKEMEVRVLISDGYFFICSARLLFSYPFYMYSAAVLSHHGIELTLKACWIWDKNEYSKTHNLSYIANQISFLKPNKQIQDLITKVDTYYHFRYPMDSKVREDVQRKLIRIDDIVPGGKPVLAGEIGSNDWIKAGDLYDYILQVMPDELYELWEEITNQYRNSSE